jgi:hypothetical protein
MRITATVTRIADRLVAAVAPRATAAACLPPEHFQKKCGCSGGLVTIKNCSTNCAGTAFCGSCFKSSIVC